MTPVY